MPTGGTIYCVEKAHQRYGDVRLHVLGAANDYVHFSEFIADRPNKVLSASRLLVRAFFLISNLFLAQYDVLWALPYICPASQA